MANVDIRGCGVSSVGWPRYERTDIADDLVALVRHLGGPAVIVGHSISGGAATIAAALAPDAIAGIVELAPFTRAQTLDVRALLRNRTHRSGTVQLARVMIGGSLAGWLSYLDIGVAIKPADWAVERREIETMMSDPDRRAVLRDMTRTSPADAGARLADVRCPALIIEGDADPDWDDPRAEGQKVVDDLPAGLGTLAVIADAGHYPHVETPDAVVALALPFLRDAFAVSAENADA